jgi:predicted pore-forming effector associated with SMODS systems
MGSSEHEYALLGGINRARVGRYLSLLAATVSASIVFLLLAAVDLAHRLGIPNNLPPAVLSLAGASAVFGALYWLFDRFAWKWPHLSALIRVPDLSGKWRCDGQTINADGSDGYKWHGTITIVQSWDKIRVRLATDQSGSNSITAALIYDEADGYRLLYNYRNDPRIGETQLKSHLGFADLVFSKDRTSADGEYFNGHGRFTFGTMKLKRV